MLKLSAIVNSIAFVLTEMDGVDHELELTEFTVADTMKLLKLQEVLHDDEELPASKQSEIIVASRIICSVKRVDTGEYYWDKMDDLLNVGYPNSLIDALYSEIDKLNPVNTVTPDEKKSKS